MSRFIPSLKSADPKPGYRLFLEFDDGVNGTVDLSTWKGKGVFELWNDESNFRDFIITDDHKLQWTEDIEMDPDAFYLKLINKSFEEYARDKQFLWHSE